MCSDHHFKDEHLFYRFKNDEKSHRSKAKFRDRLRTRSSSKKSQRGEDDDAGSVGSSENRESGGSWDSVNDSPQRNTPELDE